MLLILFFFFSPNTHCPNIEGWPTEKTVWTRSCIHSSCTSTGCPHRSAPSATSSSDGALKRRHKFRFQTAAASSHLKMVFIFLLPPRWLTTNDKLAPSDPCLFCDKCFQMLHYDAQGNKMGEFLAYPYVDHGAFN